MRCCWKSGRRAIAKLQFPVLALVVSGGHTHLYLASAEDTAWTYHNVGHTRDDAAGEAFDKVAKLLESGISGRADDRPSRTHGNPQAVKFPLRADQASRPQSRRTDRSRRRPPAFDFSYSGIKTAVLRYVETHDMRRPIDQRRRVLSELKAPTREDMLAACDQQTLDLVASFQRAMVERPGQQNALAAAEAYGVATLLVTGGVAANQELRTNFEQERGARAACVLPFAPLSTDNAAMIAAAAYPKFLANDFAAMDFSAEAALLLR